MLKDFWRTILTLGHPYKLSHQRGQYEEIADVCGTTPNKVYWIAHGRKTSNFLDDAVVSELRRRKIVKKDQL